MQATFLGCPEEGSHAGIPGKAFELDEASYARHGEATALELKKDTRTRAEAFCKKKGKGGEGPSEAFDHVFPAHPYAWQNGAQNGAKGDVHVTVRMDASDPTNAEGAFATRTGDVTDSNDARDADRTSNRVSAPARWLAANPMGVPTERDLVCESKWRPVYRFVVVRRPKTPP